MAPEMWIEPDGKQDETIQVVEEAHLGPEAEWFLRKRADAIHDGKS